MRSPSSCTGETVSPVSSTYLARHRDVDTGLGLRFLDGDAGCGLLGLDHAGRELPAEQVAVSSLHKEHVGLAKHERDGDVEAGSCRAGAWCARAEPRFGFCRREGEGRVQRSPHLRSWPALGLHVPGRDGACGHPQAMCEVVIGQPQRGLKAGGVGPCPRLWKVCHACHCTSAAAPKCSSSRPTA
jgi:hypothetical protein